MRNEFEIYRNEADSASRTLFARALRKLSAAGFNDSELKGFQNPDMYLDFGYHYHPNSGFAKPEFLKLVSDSMPLGVSDNLWKRQYFLDLFFGMAPYWAGDDTDGVIREFLAKAGGSRKLKSDFGVFINKFCEGHIATPNGNLMRFNAAMAVFAIPSLYRLFGRDPNKLAGFIEKGNIEDVKTIWKLKEANEYSDNLPAFLEGADISILERLREKFMSNVFKSRETAQEFRKYIDGADNWADTIAIFGKLTRGFKYPFVSKSEFDRALFDRRATALALKGPYQKEDYLRAIEKMGDLERERLSWNLARTIAQTGKLPEFRAKLAAETPIVPDDARLMRMIRRRENPLNPLVSMGIAKSTGFEVEYPTIVGHEGFRGVSYENMMRSFGFGFGSGGAGCDEISPGPFWCPETASLVFNKFVEAGIVDLYNFKGLTHHFNIGLRYDEGLVTLVRAMHATGAGFNDQNRFFWNSSMEIWDKDEGKGKYKEMKVYDVVKAHETVWNIESSAYLAWALGAYQDLTVPFGDGTPLSGYKWKNRLGEAWADFRRKVIDGFESIGLSQYPETENNSHTHVKKLVRQLELIFADQGARFGELDMIGSNKNEEIIPVIIDGVIWPNVSSFVRNAVNEAVGKVREIADSAEKEALDDIVEIESTKDPRDRTTKIFNFLSKYNLAHAAKGPSWSSSIAVYAEVKSVLLGA